MPRNPDTTWSARAVLHVDMDAFFAAVEQLDHPEWRGRPVIVGGSPSRRGVVATASYEARAFGVRSAMPAAVAERLCPDAVWTRGDFERYGEVSRAVRAILESFTPWVEVASIDEAYLDVTPDTADPRDPASVARDIRAAVDALGVSCSIGVATSKTVAKVASDADKPHGITVVHPGEEAAFLAPLPVRALPGIGSVTAERLERLGVRTLGELAALDDGTARSALGSHGSSTVARARGIDDRRVGGREASKSVSAERTFATDLREPRDVDSALVSLVSRVGTRLRAKGLCARTVTVKLRYADFTTRTLRRTLAEATDADAELLEAARALVADTWTPGVGLRLLGMGGSGFASAARQLELLEAPGVDPERDRALDAWLDAVRRRFGDGAVVRGAERLRRDR